jgi:hypothetical protein
MALSSTRSSISTIACECPLKFIIEGPGLVDQNGLRVCDRAPQIVARRPLFDFGLKAKLVERIGLGKSRRPGVPGAFVGRPARSWSHKNYK